MPISPEETDTGLSERRQLFLSEDMKTISTDWVPFCGRLALDAESIRNGKAMYFFSSYFMSCNIPFLYAPGIAPGVRLCVTLDYSTNDFRLLSFEKEYDTSKVVFEIADAHLVVPVGQFHPKVRIFLNYVYVFRILSSL